MSIRNGDDMADLGNALESENSGGVISATVDGKQYTSIFYVGESFPVQHCFVLVNSIFFEDPTSLGVRATNSEREELRDTRWTCQMKEPGRSAGICSRAGVGGTCRGGGIREKETRKGDFAANASTSLAIPLFQKRKGAIEAPRIVVSTMAKMLMTKYSSARGGAMDCLPVRISRINMAHTDHVPDFLPFSSSLTLSTTGSSLLTNEEVKRHLICFIGHCGRKISGRGTRATQYLQRMLPQHIFRESAAHQALQSLRDNVADADDLVKHLRDLKRLHLVEYLRFEVGKDIGLTYIFFSTIGCRELSARCGDDVGVMDSTHNISRYSYKLITILYVDSELRSRPVHFALTLQENPAIYAAFFEDVRKCTAIDLPSVIFSDPHSSIKAAVALLPERRNGTATTHLTCLWHLLDLNMKRKVGLSIPGGLSKWRHFRADFIKVRSSLSEQVLQSSFAKLLRIWFCGMDNCAKDRACPLLGYSIQQLQSNLKKGTKLERAIEYMPRYVWKIE